jgi:hypothetical protein
LIFVSRRTGGSTSLWTTRRARFETGISTAAESVQARPPIHR